MLTAHLCLLQDEKARRALKDLSSSLGCDLPLLFSLLVEQPRPTCIWHCIICKAASHASTACCMNSSNTLSVSA